MRTLKIACTLALMSLLPQLAQAGVIWAANGHEYELVNSEGISWVNANAEATRAGWYLVTVTSAAEHDFIVANILSGGSTTSRSHYWIGGTDAEQEGDFRWVNGDAWGYTNWWSGEPNNSGNEDYVAYDYRGSWAWNDAPNNLAEVYGFSRGYLRERNVGTSVPEPVTIGLLGLGLLAIGLGRRRRHD